MNLIKYISLHFVMREWRNADAPDLESGILEQDVRVQVPLSAPIIPF